MNSEKFNNKKYEEEKTGAENPKAKKQRLYDEQNLKAQMQQYFIKPGIVDNQNPQQEKS